MRDIHSPSSHAASHFSRQGTALIVVLVLLIMIFLLPLAFFLQSTIQQKTSASSSVMAMENTLAEGAIENIMSDLTQEITSGSTASNNVVTNLTLNMVYTNPVYYPTISTNAVPVLAGSSGINGLENLLKRSAYGISNYPGATCWAVNSSTTNASQNGYSVPLARWNKHLFLARAHPTSTGDTTPTNSFTPPDWVLVDRNGTAPTRWTNSLRWTATNSTTVVGRYAYAIYNEGGLLDANVAGYPVGLDTLSGSPVPGKDGPYFADLTQIGLTTNQINALVGWRNYVTANATGNFPNYVIADSGTNYALKVTQNENGFMRVFNTNVSSANTNRTDHQFSGRQQLIALLIQSDSSNVATALNALRYLGNFCRDINQPSYFPATNRPRVGTNDDAINPPFLNISVNTTNFSRMDGDTAYVGEPLVKYRFPLTTLSWITYAGPSSTALAATNASYATIRNYYLSNGIATNMLSYGTPYNITNYYGLSWNTNASWTYGVKSSGVFTTNQPIMTLSQISAAGREPNFFEMLKAAITYGSLGKSYSTNTNTMTPEGYNATYDNWTDAQIIQIGANIIDQFDPDSYPTRILFNDGTNFGGATVEIRGVEDLPYLYRVREGKIMMTNSTPSVSTLPMVTNGWSSTNGGSGVVLQEPEIWNPHAMRSSTNSMPCPTNFRLLAITTDPITASTNGNVSTTNYTIGATWLTQSSNTITWTNSTSTNLNSTNSKLSFSIPTNNQYLFREPTLLIKPGIPTNSSLAGSATYTLATNLAAYQYAGVGVSDLVSNKYIGIPMGIVPMALTATFSSNSIATGSPSTNNAAGIAPTGYVTYRTNGSTTNYGYPSVTYLLQCQDAGNNWITYDEKYTYIANATNGYGLPNTGTNTNSGDFKYNDNKSFYVDSNNPTTNNPTWSKNAIGSEWCVVAVDPRTSRFGMLFAGCNGGTNSGYSFPLGAAPSFYTTNYAPLYLSGWAAPIGTITNYPQMQYAAAQNALLTMRPDEYGGMVLSSNATGPTATNWYPGGSNSILRPGLLAQNNPNITNASGSRFNGDPVPPTFIRQFFADDDGVVRRGMSAFVPYTNSTNSPPASYPSISSNFPSGTPLLTAYTYSSSGVASATTDTDNKTINEYLSRPIILNRPFHSVAELGYVFSGTPWRNLDCSSPESGGAALLDAFCIDDTSDSLGLFAGRVDLNTRQVPVLQAILAGAYKEELNYNNSLVNSPMTNNLASAMAQALILRTHGTNSSAGPLINISELIGKWYSNNAVSGTNFINGSSSYVGFGDDQTSALTNDISAVLANTSLGTDPEGRVQRLRDATIRALASSGQTRVWNLLIDLVVQPGRYPSSATGFNNFVVDGEIHFWIHLSIDRLTGKILDRRVETLKE
jgi:Tfp pilus assembly protein PilX